MKKRILEVLRFLIAGSAGVLTYYATFYILTNSYGVWYIYSAITGSVLKTGISFLGQKYFAFRNKDRESIPKQLVWYSILSAAMFIGNLGLLYSLVQWGQLHYLVAQVASTLLLSAFSFFATRWIFTIRSRDPITP